jgi:hypothetical protein
MSALARSITGSDILDQKEGQGAPPNVVQMKARAISSS